MISISFDLAAISPQDARALGAMLAVKADVPAIDLEKKFGEAGVQDLGRVAAIFRETLNAANRPANVREKTTADLDLADHLGVKSLPDGPVEPECPLFAGCPETPQTGRPEPSVAPKEVEPVLAQPETTQAPEPVLGHVPAEPMVPKRKRRTKEQMEADELAAAAGVKNPDDKLSQEVAADPIQAGPVTAPATSVPKPEPAASAAAAATPEPTGDDLRAALKVYSKTHGMPKAIELIKDFGCERISELETKPLADRLEFMKLAQNA